MEIPNDFDMTKILPILQSFGVSPSNLGPDKMARLMNIADQISDPSKITPDVAHNVLDILGVSVRGNQKPVAHKGLKIGRNNPCPCGNGKKFKKCCGKV